MCVSVYIPANICVYKCIYTCKYICVCMFVFVRVACAYIIQAWEINENIYVFALALCMDVAENICR